MILIPQDDDEKVDQGAHQKVISKELRMLSCKTALVIVNSNTSPGHRGQRRHSEVKAIEISMMIFMMVMILMMMMMNDDVDDDDDDDDDDGDDDDDDDGDDDDDDE